MAFEEPSRAVLLTDSGKAALDTYGERFSNEEEEQRALEFVRAYVTEASARLPFAPILPAYLPPRFTLLPEVEVDDLSKRLYLKYYGGNDHVVVSQGSEDSWAPNTFDSRIVQGMEVWTRESRETSLWVSMTTRWVFSSVGYRVTFNWLQQYSPEHPSREPIALDNQKRAEVWDVTESLIADATGH
jgi:hypothetical protein